MRSHDQDAGIPTPDANAQAEALGARLRARREQVGMSAKALASAAGVSASMVSQIERGKSNPSVGTLVALVGALGVTLDELFSAEEPADADDADGGRLQPLRRDDRPTVSVADDVTWQRLTPHREQEMEFLELVYEPGAASCPPDALLRHGGREYLLVLEGRLGVTLGFRSYELEEGDSMVFDSIEPHRFWAIGPATVRVICAVTGRFGDLRATFDR